MSYRVFLQRLRSRLVFPDKRVKRWAFFYSLNLLIPTGFLLLAPLNRALAGLALMLLFAGFYLSSYFFGRRWLLTAMILEVVLMLAIAALLNPEYCWLACYPAAAIAILTENRRQLVVGVASLDTLLVVETALLSRLHQVTLSDWLIIAAIVVSSSAASFGTMWQIQVSRQQKALREANEQIERLTQAAERERTSHDLHDVMGHELSMITLKAQLVARLIHRDPERAKVEVQDIEHAARQALTRVRDYIHAIRQPHLHGEWESAVQLLVAAGIRCEVRTPDIFTADFPEGLPAFRVLAMCLRESATNIVRHSQASQALIRLQNYGDKIELLVADDGVGLVGGSGTGHGLAGMRARVEAADGTLCTWSHEMPVGGHRLCYPDIPWTTGTALCISLPLTTAANEEANAL